MSSAACVVSYLLETTFTFAKRNKYSIFIRLLVISAYCIEYFNTRSKSSWNFCTHLSPVLLLILKLEYEGNSVIFKFLNFMFNYSQTGRLLLRIL